MKSRVLVVGDTHCPVMHAGYLSHIKNVYKRYRCDTVVFIGDIVDLHGISYHEKDPELYSAGMELEMAIEQVRKLNEAFPRAFVMTGNHDALPARKARTAGISSAMIKSPNEFLKTKGWKWLLRMDTKIIDNVMYAHGDRGKQGDFAALKNAIIEGRSYVQGHIHNQAGVWWHCCQSRLIFGMNVGCGIDRTAAAMNYGKVFAKKPLLGCGVVLAGTSAFFEPMEL